jgi:NADPH:quinone reductase-like Zn-dependent oxidoreductase
MPHASRIRPTGATEVLNWSLFHYIERGHVLEASANELFEVVASGSVRIHVNPRLALKGAADPHRALEARATSGSTILAL